MVSSGKAAWAQGRAHPTRLLLAAALNRCAFFGAPHSLGAPGAQLRQPRRHRLTMSKMEKQPY
jgi:hypothetical protein